MEKYSIESQVYTVEHNKLYQYNKSTILMENNGRASISKRKIYIKAIYFFIKDQIYQGGVEV